MAVLSDTDRQKVANGFMRYLSRSREPLGAVSADDIRTLVNETDGWIDSNAVSYNSSLSEPGASELTSTQKALIFCGVTLMRYDEELLKQVFGEVD